MELDTDEPNVTGVCDLGVGFTEITEKKPGAP